ncbi:MAG: hypothetical protein AAFY36_06400 [Bacteroidota bacterium]
MFTWFISILVAFNVFATPVDMNIDTPVEYPTAEKGGIIIEDLGMN